MVTVRHFFYNTSSVGFARRGRRSIRGGGVVGDDVLGVPLQSHFC